MPRPRLTRSALAGALAGLLVTAPAMAVLFLADRLVGLPFVPFDLFDWTTRVLPGRLVTFGIDAMIATLENVGLDVADTAKTAERASALLAFLVLGLVAGAVVFAIFALLARRGRRPGSVAGLVAGLVVGAPLIAISVTIGTSTVSPALKIPWLLLVFLAWGWCLALCFRRMVPVAAGESEEEVAAFRLDRRRFLVKLGTASAVITVAGAGLARVLSRGLRGGAASAGGSGAPATETGNGIPFPNLNASVMPAPGTRPEYTPIEDHYSVFIRTEPSVVDGDSWRLEVTGLVDRPLELTLPELRSRFEKHDQFTTISCISGRVGTGLIGTTLWSGPRLRDVLEAAGLKEGARWLHVRSADGYYETVDLALLESDPPLLLCYDWDGRPLPEEHGFPLRIWIPDRYGMKQPKWIESMEVSSEYTPGYWVERHWDRDAIVKATSVVDTVAVGAAYEEGGKRKVPVGGIAFAGVRGISKVEVRVDQGAWQPAELRQPLSDYTWVLWRYDWPFEAGEHTFEVRCFEADGTPQVEEAQKNRPSGATGIDHETVKV